MSYAITAVICLATGGVTGFATAVLMVASRRNDDGRQTLIPWENA